jgi:hypothetical protein
LGWSQQAAAGGVAAEVAKLVATTEARYYMRVHARSHAHMFVGLVDWGKGVQSAGVSGSTGRKGRSTYAYIVT